MSTAVREKHLNQRKKKVKREIKGKIKGRTKFSTLPNLKVFSCEAFPTFSRVQCKPWFGTYCNW